MSKKRAKMTRDTLPEGFTLALAAVDAVPVLFFSATMVLAGLRLRSVLFLLGASMALFAGAAKVLWKFIVVLKKKNIRWMSLQMRVLMPPGLLLMLASLAVPGRVSAAGLRSAFTAMPSALFFAAGFLGMVLMMVFAFNLNSDDPKANWIEQLTNGAAQAAFFLGVLLLP